MQLRSTIASHLTPLRQCAFAVLILVSLALPIPIVVANTLPVSVAAGGSHTCVLRSDGSVVCWGRNDNGQASPPAAAFQQLAAGSEYTCGIRTDGTVSCWGANYAGQSSPPSGTFTQISAGAYHSCGVKSDGSLACWGSNGFGQAAPPAGTFLQVSAGWSSSCAIRTDQTLTCWGNTTYGQIAPPTGTFLAIATGSAHSCGIRSDGSAACWGYNSAGQATPPGGTFTQISAGVYHTCALTSLGAIVCWGSNTNGQLNLPSGTFTHLDAGEYHTCAVHSDNMIGCWGYNGAGQAPSIQLNYSVLPNGNVDTAYDLQFNAYGGTSPYTYAAAAGTLPAGLTLSTNGRLSGTPTSTGTYSFTITAIDTRQLSGSRTYTMTIETALPITLSPIALPSGRVDVSYTQQLSATHGLAPYTFAVSAGSLPTGITLSADGQLAGTPTATGTFSSTVQATDARGRTGTGIAAITVYRAATSDLTDSGAVLLGAAQSAAVWGDYDNDGDLDLALAGLSANGPVTRIYQSANGSLIDSGIALPGISNAALAWGDYDSDGDLDLALAGTSANGPIAKIYRNAGSFNDIGAVLPGFGGPLAWGDYDNDGDLDLAIVGSGINGPTTQLFRNMGGSFAYGGSLLNLAASALAWGDYDNDGDLDLAIAGNNRFYQPFTYVLRNIGGSFSDSGTILPAVSNAALAWGDYDSDGDFDLAIAGNGLGGPITAIYRNMNGVFSDSGATLPGSGGGALAWGDYDNDGDLDLALSGLSASGAIAHLFVNTSNGFVESGVVFPDVTAGALAWGDYDDDGDLDLALAGKSETDAIAKIYRNNAAAPNASPSAPSSLVADVAGTSATLHWDASGDSRTAAAGLSYNIRIGTIPGGIDIVSPMAGVSDGFRQLPQLGRAGHTRSLTIKQLSPGRTYYWSVQAIDTSFAGSPFAIEGSFTVLNFEPNDTGLPSVTTGAVAWGDYDNDGDLDAAIAGDSDGTALARIYQNTGGVLADIAAGLPGVGQTALAWGDYDNDGDLDLALAGASANGPIAKIYCNTGASFVDTAASLPGVQQGALAWGDYDNDGDLDLALAGTSLNGPVTRIYERTTTGFTDASADLPGLTGAALAWGDYDNNGDLDLALAGASTNGPIARIYRNTGASLSDSGISLAGVSEAALGWGDYDNDGDLDLALAGASTNGPIARIYRNAGASLSDSGISLAGVSEAALGWGDYDNDGDLDLALAGTGTAGTVARVYQNTQGTFATLGLALPDSNAGALAWGDVDRDGDLDILLSGAAGGRIYRNNMLVANRPPSAPTGLTVELGTLVTLRWSAASDTETPAAALTYNLRIGTTPGGSDVLAPMASAPGGYRRVSQSGNAGQRTIWSTRRLAPGRTYYWSVQAVDGAFAGSSFAAEGSFTLPLFGEIANTGLTGISYGAVAWADYDNDGDLDLALTGRSGADVTTRIYRNTGSGLSDIGAQLLGAFAGGLAWGDYDNDGDLDLLVSGASTSQELNTLLYRNDNGNFLSIDLGLPSISNSSLSWGDYDNDGDLDILLSGNASGTPITRIYRNDHGQFADARAGLTGLYWGAATWSDYDNDGDLDLLISGCTVSGGATGCERTLIYRNNGGSFYDIKAGLPGTVNGTAVWGDYDNDGDLDILLSGNGMANARVYRNTGTGFQDIGAALTPNTYGAAAWGDYDNDGDLDILLSGTDWGTDRTKVYRNDNGQFVDSGAGMVGVIYSAVAWGDYDNDGDLDALVTGNLFGSHDTRLYRNNTAVPNRSPGVPTGLVAEVAASSATLRWNTASDRQTLAAALNYNLRIGTTPGGSDVLAPMASPLSGERRVLAIGNAGQRTSWTIRNLAPETTYYWSVQSIDSAFAGSHFAQEHSFITPALAQFSTATPTVNEQAGSISLTILSNDSTVPLTVQYATIDGSASAPADYTRVSGSLNWASGDTSVRTISIPIINDALDEADEALTVTLRAAGTVVATATLTIVDDDLPPVVQVEQSTSPVHTSAGTAIFTVTLSAPSGQTINVVYRIDVAPTQGLATTSALSGTITFAPGETRQTIHVQLDSLPPNQQSLRLTLQSADHASLGAASTVITIIDDGPPPAIPGFRIYIPIARG